MLNWIKKVLPNKKVKKPEQKLDITYTNEITFLDIDQHTVNIKVRSVGEKTFLYIHGKSKDDEIILDQDAACFLNAILTDYVENGNLNKVEEVLETEE